MARTPNVDRSQPIDRLRQLARLCDRQHDETTPVVEVKTAACLKGGVVDLDDLIGQRIWQSAESKLVNQFRLHRIIAIMPDKSAHPQTEAGPELLATKLHVPPLLVPARRTVRLPYLPDASRLTGVS